MIQDTTVMHIAQANISVCHFKDKSSEWQENIWGRYTEISLTWSPYVTECEKTTSFGTSVCRRYSRCHPQRITNEYSCYFGFMQRAQNSSLQVQHDWSLNPWPLAHKQYILCLWEALPNHRWIMHLKKPDSVHPAWL